MRRLALAPALVGVLVASAGGAAPPPLVDLGETFYPSGSSNCGGITWLQNASPGSSYAVPTGGGVITEFRVQLGATAPTTVSFRLGRETSPGNWEVVASGPAVPTSANQFIRQRLQVPAQAGDVLGFYPNGVESVDCGVSVGTDAGYQYRGGSGDITSGAVVGQSGNFFQFSLGATVEPDVDGDGFGDITQDDCGSDPTTQGACPDPRTKITKVSVNHVTNRVTVRFRADLPGSSFRCGIDGHKLRPCTSPYAKKLPRGRHSVTVQATSSSGQTDQTPAVKRFRVR